MKKQHRLVRIIIIGLLTLASWYFFVKKYTYEFEMNTSLEKAILVEMLTITYPATHPDLALVERFDNNLFIFKYTDDGVSFIQEIRIKAEASAENRLQIGVNADGDFLQERFARFYKETLVQVFNQFLLLQLDTQIVEKENLTQ